MCLQMAPRSTLRWYPGACGALLRLICVLYNHVVALHTNAPLRHATHSSRWASLLLATAPLASRLGLPPPSPPLQPSQWGPILHTAQSQHPEAVAAATAAAAARLERRGVGAHVVCVWGDARLPGGMIRMATSLAEHTCNVRCTRDDVYRKRKRNCSWLWSCWQCWAPLGGEKMGVQVLTELTTS